MDKYTYANGAYSVLVYFEELRFAHGRKPHPILVVAAEQNGEHYFHAKFAEGEFFHYQPGDLISFELNGRPVRDVQDYDDRLILKLRMKVVGFLKTFFSDANKDYRDHLYSSRERIMKRFGGPELGDLCDED